MDRATALIDELASKTMKALSKDEIMRVAAKTEDIFLSSPNDEEKRLRELTRSLGMGTDETQELSSYAHSGGALAGGIRRQASQMRVPAMPTVQLEGAAETGTEAGAPGGDPVPPPSSPSARVPIASKKKAKLGPRAQVWAIMDDPTSSRAAQIVAATILACILLSCMAFVLQTLPQYGDDAHLATGAGPGAAWAIVEAVCVAVFTLEFTLRVGSTPSLRAFVQAPLNIIDFVAIAPFYLELLLGSENFGSQIIRILRLVRIFRIFKISRYLPWVRVFSNALKQSVQPLVMLVLVVCIACVLFSSVMYYAERGEWSEQEAMWMRPTRAGPVPSPYQSIPITFWWCIVTMTTVGYGDITPVTAVGRLIAAVASLCGILVVAIPVSVISTNFTGEYGKLVRSREQVKARMNLLRRQFRYDKTGLEAVIDEVEDIVARNTQELEGEVASLFDQTRLELTEELTEILKMAYERRRQLHLAALSAGRVQPADEVDEVSRMSFRGSSAAATK
jgi:hypothetical protein